MRKRVLITAVIVILITHFYSCEKFFLGRDTEDNTVENFEYLWNDVLNRYSYLDYKGIDWDSVYQVYRPMITEEMTNYELFDVLADMLYNLRDGHVNITSSFNRSRNWDWFLDYPPNFNKNIIDINYLGKDFFITGPLRNRVVDSVLYVYYSSFSERITNDHLDELITRASGLKGVIIDVRHNGGGSLSNAYLIASRFASVEVLFGRDRIKSGPKGNDFTQWRSMMIKPYEGVRYEGDVVVLCNRRSYSASSFFALMMKALPNAVLMGDDTGGGGGVPAFGELPNGWLYRLSATQTTDPDGKHIESGVSVDIRVDLDPADEAQGFDTILETALNMLR